MTLSPNWKVKNFTTSLIKSWSYQFLSLIYLKSIKNFIIASAKLLWPWRPRRLEIGCEHILQVWLYQCESILKLTSCSSNTSNGTDSVLEKPNPLLAGCCCGAPDTTPTTNNKAISFIFGRRSWTEFRVDAGACFCNKSIETEGSFHSCITPKLCNQQKWYCQMRLHQTQKNLAKNQ